MDIDTRIQAKDLEDEYRDKADESRSQLDKNINLSTASRLAAIKHDVSVDPDAKNKVMYRDINPHKIGFVGVLPSNKSFSKYRSIDTKLFGIGDTINKVRGWVGNKADYVKGEVANLGNRWGELANGNEAAYHNYMSQLMNYYDQTGKLDLNQFYIDNGINPNNLSDLQRQALTDMTERLRDSSYHRDPLGERNYQQYGNINQALNDPKTRANAQQWMNGVGTDKNGQRVTGLNNGLTARNRANVYNQMHQDFYNNSDYYNKENGLDNKDVQNAYQTKYRNQALANQVNTYQNSLNQYQQHKAELDKLNSALQEYQTLAVKDSIDPKELTKLHKKYKLNGDPQSVILQLQSQIKGHQAMMNKANYDLRAQGLTGLTDNMDPRNETNYSGYGKGQAYVKSDPNDPDSSYVMKDTGTKVDKFTGLAMDFQGRIKKYQSDVNQWNNELKSGNLSEEKKQELQNKINAANKTIDSSKAWLSKMGLTETSDLKNLTDEEKNRFNAMKGRYEDSKSTANRRANEVTDVNQYRAITGEDVQTVDPTQVVHDAQQNYNNQYQVAYNKAKQNYENNIHKSDNYKKDYNEYIKNNKVTKTIKKNGKDVTVVDWDATKKNFRNDYLKKHAFREDEFKNNFNSGKGYDLYNTLENAKKVQNSPMQIMTDANDNTVYGNKTAAIDTTPQPKSPYRQVQSPGYQAPQKSNDEIKRELYGG